MIKVTYGTGHAESYKNTCYVYSTMEMSRYVTERLKKYPLKDISKARIIYAHAHKIIQNYFNFTMILSRERFNYTYLHIYRSDAYSPVY